MSLQISKIKHWLSFFYEQPLAQSSSIYNPTLEVCLSRGRLRLNTKNATYSYEDLYDAFYEPFRYLNISQLKLKKVLVLGGGLASVPIMLQKKFRQNDAIYTLVELDEAVIKLAQEFVAEKYLKNVIFYCDDAYDYVTECKEKFDLIAVDIFLDICTPNKFRSADFLNNLEKILAPDAHLIYNTLMLDDISAEMSNDFYKNNFSTIFPKNQQIRTKGNNMLLFQESKS